MASESAFPGEDAARTEHRLAEIREIRSRPDFTKTKVRENAFAVIHGVTSIMACLDTEFCNRLHSHLCTAPEVQDKRLLALPPDSYHVTLKPLESGCTCPDRGSPKALRALQRRLKAVTDESGPDGAGSALPDGAPPVQDADVLARSPSGQGADVFARFKIRAVVRGSIELLAADERTAARLAAAEKLANEHLGIDTEQVWHCTLTYANKEHPGWQGADVRAVERSVAEAALAKTLEELGAARGEVVLRCGRPRVTTYASMTHFEPLFPA